MTYENRDRFSCQKCNLRLFKAKLTRLGPIIQVQAGCIVNMLFWIFRNCLSKGV